MIKLRLPLRDIFVNQPFGVNYVDFYRQLGMLGHNGVDFKAYTDCPCYATHSGVVYYAGTDDTGGIGVHIWDEQNRFKTISYHLKSHCVTQGQQINAGDLIGLCDNTGPMTTGSHLHFTLKNTTADGSTLDWNNGYKGAIDPAPYFVETYNGITISNRDWDKSRAYHRYYRGRPNGGLWIERYRVVPALTKYLKRLPTNEQINACTYGGWDREAVANPAMYQNWSQLKKDEFMAGQRSFQ